MKEKLTTIDLRMSSIILLIGPSGCGKTYFTKNKLIPELKLHGDNINIQHVSSDKIRRNLLGDSDESLSKMDTRMMHASKEAFSIVNSSVRSMTSYPINSDFVIVDSTGLSKNFRDDIKKIADDNNYNLVVLLFDYKGREPYIKYLTDGEESKAVTSRQLKYMRENIMRDVNKKKYRDIFKIKSHNLDEYKIKIINYNKYQECLISDELDYVIIGDIHGCYDELIELLEKNGFVIDNGKLLHEKSDRFVILLGDLIDKGYGVKSVVEFVYDNIDKIHMVKGNHENFVYRFLKNLDGDEGFKITKKELPPQEIIDTYFDSIKLFEKDEELKMKFYKIVESMKPFLKHKDFIVTHAPCESKYLGKLGSKSEKNQRTIVYPKRFEYDNKQEYMAAKSNFFKKFRSEASRSYPTHLFGHVSGRGIAQLYNKINLDSGAVSGGHLSSIIVNAGGRNLLKRVSSFHNDKIIKKELSDFLYVPEEKISIDNLEVREKKRILYAAENKVNFISGTVCPANKKVVKDENNNIIIEESELESLDKAIEYYKKSGVDKVIAQIKYMGSRANIYLNKDIKKNYTTTRNGYLIKPETIELSDAYKPLYDLPFIKESFNNGTELFILDAELLPWSAIGRGLIDRNFVTVDKAMESEIKFLKENGFEDAIKKVVNGPYKDCDFENISYKTPRKDLIKLIGSNNENTFRHIKNYIKEFPSIDELSELTKVYSRQIELFGSDGEVHFKPFSILKQVFADGTEKLFFDESNEDVYKSINNDNYVVIDLNKKEDIDNLRKFYEKTTIDNELEGIMIKPLKVYVNGVASSMKVRNKNYLTIVYGPDYQTKVKLKKLIHRKKINRKLSLSIKEFEIGKRMLEIQYNLINKENEHYIQACGEMVVEVRKERELDPRL